MLSPGQWFNEPARGVPRTRDGKPNLAAPAPRANGKSDSRLLCPRSPQVDNAGSDRAAWQDMELENGYSHESRA
jgi:hypothetical protein